MRGGILIAILVLSLICSVPASAGHCTGGRCLVSAVGQGVATVAQGVKSRREARIERRQARRGG